MIETQRSTQDITLDTYELIDRIADIREDLQKLSSMVGRLANSQLSRAQDAVIRSQLWRLLLASASYSEFLCGDSRTQFASYFAVPKPALRTGGMSMMFEASLPHCKVRLSSMLSMFICCSGFRVRREREAPTASVSALCHVKT
jgi:hypothetical protein